MLIGGVFSDDDFKASLAMAVKKSMTMGKELKQRCMMGSYFWESSWR